MRNHRDKLALGFAGTAGFLIEAGLQDGDGGTVSKLLHEIQVIFVKSFLLGTFDGYDTQDPALELDGHAQLRFGGFQEGFVIGVLGHVVAQVWLARDSHHAGYPLVERERFLGKPLYFRWVSFMSEDVKALTGLPLFQKS